MWCARLQLTCANKLQHLQGVKSILKAYQQFGDEIIKSAPLWILQDATRKGWKGAELIYISLFCVQIVSHRGRSSPRRKERENPRLPLVDPDQPHPASLCDPDRSCPDVRLSHNGGKETALTPRLCPSRCGSVCLLLHPKYLHSGT